jgi:hypothetical protein
MNTETLRAFHGDPAVKAKYMARVEAHRRADEIIQGKGWSDGKGCAIGCTLDNYDHSRYPIELGLPVWLAHLEDAIHEGLPLEDAKRWPGQLLEAIPEGADVEPVRDRVAIKRLEWLFAHLAETWPDASWATKVRTAIIAVIDALRDGNKQRRAQAEAQAEAAMEAAWAAADAAWTAEAEPAAARAARAAFAAAEAAAGATLSAVKATAAAEAAESAESAESAWIAEAKRAAAWRRERDWLLAALRECPPSIAASGETDKH